MKDDDTESRKAFEKWIAVRYPAKMGRWPADALARMTGKVGIYVDRFIQIAWEAWCESSKSICAENKRYREALEKIAELDDTGIFPGGLRHRRIAREAL